MPITCAICGHPGAHATVIPATEGVPVTCTGCPICQREAKQGQDDLPDARK